MKASFRSIAGWILASLLIFASQHRSEAFTWTKQPDNPTILVEGANTSRFPLEWNFNLNQDESISQITIKRGIPQNSSRALIALKSGPNAFDVSKGFESRYEANLPLTLVLLNVDNIEEYLYFVEFSYNSGGLKIKESEVHVIVNVPPKITVVPERQSRVQVGENFTLTCNASGDPRPQILWTKEGVASKDYNVSGYKLHLVEVKRTDVGSYKCTANNGYGIATSLSVVSVKCPTNGCQTKTVGITITDDQKWPWKSAYNNTDSIEYKKLQSSLTSAIARIYTKNPVKQLYRQAIVELRSGSVIVAYVQLLFGTGVNDPLQPLRDEVAKGKLGPFNVNRVLVVVPTIPPSTTLTQETTTGTRAPPNNAGADTNSGLSTVAVTGIVIGILLITVVALTTYIFWFKRQGRRDDRQNEKHEEIGVSHFHNVVETEDERNSDNVATSGLRQRDIEIREVSQSLERSTETNTSHYSEISEYAALHPATRSWEVPKENVTIEKVIGEGAFGQVAQGTASQLRGGEGTATVAIKMLKAGAPESDRKDLLSELEVMKTLKPHRHVIKLLGCVTESDPILVIIEYVPYGDLLGYLRKSRGLNDFYYKDPDVKPQTSLTSQQLMKFSWQVADGMSYLSSRNIIHRDLAARNVLVGEQETCKVTDFGMARDVHQENIYEKKTMGRIPVKWTAYEALMYGQYTTKSDVWSFGVVLYEIFTIGGAPYPRTNGRKMADLLLQGYRMPKPNHVDSALYQIMLNCWQEDPDNRPTFENLRRELKQMENQHKRLISMKDYNKKLYENVEDLIF